MKLDPESAEHYPSGALLGGTLLVDTAIGAVTCKRDHDVIFYESRALKMGYLSRPEEIRGIPCAATSYTFFHENGAVWNVTLASPLQLGAALLEAGTRATFDEQGGLLEWRELLKQDQTIDGIPCTDHVWRRPSGKLSVAFLAGDHEIEGRELAEWTELTLDEAGRLIDTNARSTHPSELERRIYGAFIVEA